MTNKQPDPKQGSELDNKLDAIFMATSTIYTDKYGEVTPFLVPMQYELELKRQLKVIIQTSVQKARIEELNKVIGGYSWIDLHNLEKLKLNDGTKFPITYIKNRLSELTKQKKELENAR